MWILKISNFQMMKNTPKKMYSLRLCALAVQDEVFSDEETFYVQNVLFDKSSKKLTFERASKNKKGKSRSTIDTKNMLPSKLSSIHRITRDALDVSIVNVEEENLILKERVKELEKFPHAPTYIGYPSRHVTA